MDTPAEIVAALRPVRMPRPTDAETLADALAAFSLGLVCALVALALLRFVLARRTPPGRAVSAELDAARGLPAGERMLVQATLLGRLAPPLPGVSAKRVPSADVERLEATLGAGLYRPEPGIDLDAVDAGLVALASRSRRA